MAHLESDNTHTHTPIEFSNIPDGRTLLQKREKAKQDIKKYAQQKEIDAMNQVLEKANDNACGPQTTVKNIEAAIVFFSEHEDMINSILGESAFTGELRKLIENISTKKGIALDQRNELARAYDEVGRKFQEAGKIPDWGPLGETKRIFDGGSPFDEAWHAYDELVYQSKIKNHIQNLRGPYEYALHSDLFSRNETASPLYRELDAGRELEVKQGEKVKPEMKAIHDEVDQARHEIYQEIRKELPDINDRIAWLKQQLGR
jgi:hypothetical protein